MMNKKIAFASAVLFLASAAAACPRPTGNNTASNVGDASLTVTPNGGTSTTMDFDSGSDVLNMTQPNGRVFTLSYSRPNPPFTIEVRVNGNGVRENDTITFPLTGSFTEDDIRIVATFEGRTYGSNRAGTSGELFVQELNVTDESADFRGNMDIVLGSDSADAGGGSLRVVGFVEGHFASLQDTTGLDAGF